MSTTLSVKRRWPALFALFASLAVVLGSAVTPLSAKAADVPAPITMSVTASKTLSGASITDDAYKNAFEFTIEAVTAGAPLPAKTTVRNSGGSISFGDITFEKAGTYEYKVSEVKPSESLKGVTYDSTPKKLTVVVENQNGTLVVTNTDGTDFAIESSNPDGPVEGFELTAKDLSKTMSGTKLPAEYDWVGNTNWMLASKTGEVVYCIDFFRSAGVGETYSYTGEPQFTDQELVKRILYYGYPNDGGPKDGEFMTWLASKGATGEKAQNMFNRATQLAIWTYQPKWYPEQPDVPVIQDLPVYEGTDMETVMELKRMLGEKATMSILGVLPWPEGASVDMYEYGGSDSNSQPIMGFKIVNQGDTPPAASASATGKLPFANSYAEVPSEVTVKISKADMGGTEVAGAKIKVTGPDSYAQEWTSGTEPKSLTLKPGDYTLTEVSEPAGYQKVTTQIAFSVDAEGKVTVTDTTVEPAGAVEVTPDNRLILKDAYKVPTVKTTAKAAGGNSLAPAKNQTITDTVELTNLKADVEYTLTGKLVDSQGTEVPATCQPLAFTATAADEAAGTVTKTMTFTGIDATALAGQNLVVFETLSWTSNMHGKTKKVEHKDLEDAAQTVPVGDVPAIGTDAVDSATKDHIAMADEEVTIVDTVAYRNLTPGKEYTLSGKLVKKSDQKVVAEATRTFTPEAAKGTVDLEFTFNGSALAGDSVVAFETVSLDGEEVATHADINDELQTVVFPKARTTAVDKADNNKVVSPDKKVTVVDTVAYTNLIPGKEYTLSGKLVKKSDQKVVAEATATFTAAKKSGKVDLEFTFNASALAGEALVAFERVSYNDEVVAVHEDITDQDQTVTVGPKIGTTAVDSETQDHIAKADSQVTIIDTVAYEGLIPGKEYKVSGTLMKKSTGDPLVVDGTPVTAEKTFAPEAAKGTVELEFTFNGSDLAGDSVVAFETVSLDGEEVATHADLKDEGQTVVLPKAGTTAVDSETKEHMAMADEEVTIVDTVAYEGLIPGKEYTLSGKLVTKSSKGKDVVAEATRTFTPEAADGTVDLEFTFNGSALAGDSVVAFETISLNNVEVATHADLKDADQTVDFPKASTKAVDKADKNNVVAPAKKVTVVDTVTYTGLVIGKEYKVSGTLMKKSDGKELVVNGKPVTAEKTFTATKKNGTVKLEFTFDASALAGEALVAFERVSYNDKVVAVHEDINDQDQTVTVDEIPEIGTTATDNTDGDKVIEIGAKAEVKDVVSYRNLKPGTEYTLSGQLVKKSDESVVAEASTTFTPEATEGTVELVFTVDTSDLAGHELVAFEKVSLGEDEVATHADIDDEGQTVTVGPAPAIGTLAYDEQTRGPISGAVAGRTLNDVVSYENLVPGKTYTLKALLVQKSNQAVKGSASATFVVPTDAPTAGMGFETVTFENVDLTGLEGDAVVAFEYLFEGEAADVTLETLDDVAAAEQNEAFVVEHANIEDAFQTVIVPEIRTTATGADGEAKTVAPEEKAKVVDTVAYKNLLDGYTYRFEGQLVKKDDPTQVLDTAEKDVTIDQAGDGPTPVEGTETLEFEFDASALAGSDVVVFEKVYLTGPDELKELVGSHEDVNDKNQTVKVEDLVPEIGTTATDNTDGDKVIEIGAKAEVKDVVSYKNLKPGTEYTLSGKLVKKTDESAVAEGTKTFTPEAAEGTVELVFTFDASALADGEELVAFEKVTLGGEEVAAHEDINSPSQTVGTVGSTSAVFTKKWLNAEGWEQAAPGDWPLGMTISVQLLKDGQPSGDPIELGAQDMTPGEAGIFSYTVSDLEDGHEWTFEEIEREGDNFLIEDDGKESGSAVNRLTPVKSERTVAFAKVDADTSAPVPGAELKLTGKFADGTEFEDTWISKEEPNVMELVPGTYTLEEVKAPEGYLVAASIEIVIDEATGAMTVDGAPVETGTVTMADEKVPDDIPTTPAPSGDDTPVNPTPGSDSVVPNASGTPGSSSASVRSKGVATTTSPLSRTGAAAGIGILAALALAGSGVMLLRRRDS